MDRVELKSRTVFCKPLHERAVKRNVKQGGQKHLRTGAGAIDCQAKTLIPSNLREFAQLGKEVVFIGMGKRAEIWDKTRWEEKNAEVEMSIEDIASDMEESGFSI